MVGKSENFFGNRNDPRTAAMTGKIKRVFTHARAFPLRYTNVYSYIVVCVGTQSNYNILRCIIIVIIIRHCCSATGAQTAISFKTAFVLLRGKGSL